MRSVDNPARKGWSLMLRLASEPLVFTFPPDETLFGPIAPAKLLLPGLFFGISRREILFSPVAIDHVEVPSTPNASS